MSGVEVGLSIVGGVTVFVAAAVGAFYGLYRLEVRSMRRNRERAARVHPLNVPGVRRALDQAASRDNLR